MTYPLLRLSKTHARVEIRKSSGPEAWEDMTVVFSGSAKAGKEWKGAEGEKLCGAVGRWDNRPDSKLGLPYCIKGRRGVGKGRPVEKTFP